MAMRYGYFDSEITGVDENGMPIFDRAETSDLFRMLFANLVSSGVLASPGDCFQVLADTGMTVRVRPGFAMIKGAFAYDADEATLTIPASNASLPRLDRVVLRCNYLDRLCELVVKTGTPATVPVAPVLLQPTTGDYYELGLATVRVDAGTGSITQSAIGDTRADSSVCGFITQLIDHIDTSAFMQQLTAWQEEYSAEQQAAFESWFEQIRDQLSEDAAGNLQNQINSTNQSMTALAGRVGAIEEFDEEITEHIDNLRSNNIAAGYGTATKSLTQNFVIMPIAGNYTIGPKFTRLSDGGYRCLNAGLVLVSAYAYVSGINASDVVAVNIGRYNGGWVWQSNTYFPAGGSERSVNIANMPIAVNAGDIIYLRARNITAARGTAEAFLLVIEYV